MKQNSLSKAECKHKVLKFGEGRVVGGSCLDPSGGCNIYVALDTGVSRKYISFPWEEKKFIGFLYPITNFDVPKDPKRFKAMCEWLAKQVEAGKRVHVGCMAGHGRTGMVLAGITYVLTGRKDSIMYVRNNYCHKAVETPEQVQFLVDLYGVDSAKARYAPKGATWDAWDQPGRVSSGSRTASDEEIAWVGGHKPSRPVSKGLVSGPGLGTKTFRPVPVKSSIW